MHKAKQFRRILITCWDRNTSTRTFLPGWETTLQANTSIDTRCRQPQPRLPLYHLVGALDPLTAAEQAVRLNDGLPETLEEWILAEGLTHLKIKLNGDDLPWDVQRVVDVERVATDAQALRGASFWVYSLDFNEKCVNVAYVLEFLIEVQERAPGAFQRVQYIEQPTHRDLHRIPNNKCMQPLASSRWSSTSPWSTWRVSCYLEKWGIPAWP